MANTVTLQRSHLILALCLPLAIVVGYVLAEPLESGSLAVLVLVMCVLSVPLMMKWNHPLLILTWNASIALPFFQRNLPVWMVIATVSVILGLLNRSLGSRQRSVSVPSVTTPLMFLGGVVLLTAFLTGGIGIGSLGAAHYGGRNYVSIFAALAGYFALTSRGVSVDRAELYLAMFFLPALSALCGDLIYLAGPNFYFLYYLFPLNEDLTMSSPGAGPERIERIEGLYPASLGLYAYLLARYGLRGVLDPTQSLRFGLFLLTVVGCMMSGFRSALILFGLAFILLFYFEGLWRTRFLVVFLGVSLVGLAVVVPNMRRLPMAVQRSLSFLPLPVDPVVRANAEGSTDWRVNMWKNVLPEVPKHLLMGKGYTIDPGAMFFAEQAGYRFGDVSAGSALAGDYHNGPLSVLIPFGLFGMAGFLWFLTAALRVLYGNYRSGDVRLKRVNTFLLAVFIAKSVFFFVVFGSLFSDLYFFVGIIGLSMCLNSRPLPDSTLLDSTSEAEPAFEPGFGEHGN